MTGRDESRRPLQGRGGGDTWQRLRDALADPMALIGLLWGLTAWVWERAPWFIRKPTSVVTRTFQWYMADNCSIYAAAIAYYSIFSLVPLTIIILSVFGLVVPEERMVEFVFDQFALQQTASVQEDVESLVRQARNVSAPGLGVGIVALIWSASGIFSAVRRGLNATSHLKRSRPYWHEKLIDFGLIPAFGLMITVSIALTAASQFVIGQVEELGPFTLDQQMALQWTTRGLAAAVSFVMFALLYRFVPTARPSWKEALVGAVLATLLFETAKYLTALGIGATAFSRDAAIFAGPLAFLFWMMINGSILLVGSEFGRAVVRPAEEREPAEEPVAATPPV